MYEKENVTVIKKAQEAWDKLSLANNFLFQKVMMNQELCKKVLSEILGVEIDRIEYTDYEKTIDIRYDSKAIRLDVYVKDEFNTVYNIEMQNAKEADLPKRGRYYQGLIDMDLLEKGFGYEKLNKSIVIFICTFDYYEMGRYKYTFNNVCSEEPGLEYGDETTKIIINTYGTKGEISEDLRDFFNAINGEYSNSKFSDTLKTEVDKVKLNMKARRQFMYLYVHEEDIRRKSLKQGMEKGIEKGIELLVADNISEGKSDDKIVEKLMKLYGLEKEKAKDYYNKYR